MSYVLRRCAADLTTVEIDGEVSVYHPDTDLVTMLNATATDVFTLCDGTLDEAGIVDLLDGAYDVDRDTITDGVRQALHLLLDQGLVIREPATGAP